MSERRLMFIVQVYIYTHTHRFNGLFSGTTRVSRYQKGKTNLDFTEARGSEWQWHQLGHMQVCTSFQTDNHASTPPLSYLQAGCPSCRPTNSVEALKATVQVYTRRSMTSSQSTQLFQGKERLECWSWAADTAAGARRQWQRLVYPAVCAACL